MVSFLIGFIGAITALVGWFRFQSVLLLIVGTILYIVETIMEWQSLNLNAKKMDAVIFIFGSIIAMRFTSAPWYAGGMVAISIYSLILGIFGWIVYAKIFFKIIVKK